MKVNHALKKNKKRLKNGELDLTLHGCSCCGILIQIDLCIGDCYPDYDIEVYRFFIKNTDTENIIDPKITFEKIAEYVCEFHSDYGPEYLYIIWEEVRERGLETDFLFEVENKRRSGGFDTEIELHDLQKEKTLNQIIEERSMKASIIQGMFRMFVAKKIATSLRHEPRSLFDKEFGERRRKMLGVQDHLWNL